jgi:hypothetical protein
MIATGAFAERYPTGFKPTSDVPIINFADQLIHLCGPEGSILDRQGDKCWCRPIRGGTAIEIPLPAKLFRSFLARIAAICNEYREGSVSPYGGEGVLLTGGEPRLLFQVSFTNTLDSQRLEIRPVAPEGLNGTA